VVLFLRSGISEHTILLELHDRGFAEPLDMTRETALRQAGASETLVVAVRRAAPTGAGSPVAPPPVAASPSPRAASAPPGKAEGPRGLSFGATTRSVRVPVSVLDKRGEPILGLSGDDFQITEDGKKQHVTYFSGE